MTRFLLFGFDDYYHAGGWNDFCGAFDTLEDAQAFTKKARMYCNYRIVDAEANEVVWEV